MKYLWYILILFLACGACCLFGGAGNAETAENGKRWDQCNGDVVVNISPIPPRAGKKVVAMLGVDITQQCHDPQYWARIYFTLDGNSYPYGIFPSFRKIPNPGMGVTPNLMRISCVLPEDSAGKILCVIGTIWCQTCGWSAEDSKCYTIAP